MPRKKKQQEPEQHRRIRPGGKAGIRTIHVNGWENEYRPYCVQPGDKRPPEVSPPKEIPYNKTHGKKRHEPATVDPEVKRINEADWRNRRITKPDTI